MNGLPCYKIKLLNNFMMMFWPGSVTSRRTFMELSLMHMLLVLLAAITEVMLT